MTPKTFAMWAVPYNRLDLNDTLDVEEYGAMALFALQDEAQDFIWRGTYRQGTLAVKVRVTIERSGRRRKAK